VGYAVAAPDIAEGLRRTAIPFSVTALAQRAAIASLDAARRHSAYVPLDENAAWRLR
jgi:histidinol-phosphate aminotransferase